MSVLLRKLRSFVSLVGTPSRLPPAICKNLAKARGKLNGGCFSYSSAMGMPFVCFPDNETSLRLYIHGYQETAEIQLARGWLCPGDFCIDAGANVGLLSVAFGFAVGEKGCVLAIEPSPFSFARLAETVRHL